MSYLMFVGLVFLRLSTFRIIVVVVSKDAGSETAIRQRPRNNLHIECFARSLTKNTAAALQLSIHHTLEENFCGPRKCIPQRQRRRLH